MFTDFWKIDLGTTLSILVPAMAAAAAMVYRVCGRVRAVEDQIASQGQRQEQRYADVASKLVERNALQDARHRENQEAITAIQRILMNRRDGRQS